MSANVRANAPATVAKWGNHLWGWGSPSGAAAAAEKALAKKLRSAGDRSAFLAAAREGKVDEASLKLSLGLTMRRFGPCHLPPALQEAYASLVAGGFEPPTEGGFAKLARVAAPAVARYNLNVMVSVKPARRAEFLEVIRANAAGTLLEPRNLRYCWGPSAGDENVFHFQESFVEKAGFEAHCAAPHFAKWEAFVATDPFSAEPSVQFYEPATSLADDAAPCVVVAAALALLGFAEAGW